MVKKSTKKKKVKVIDPRSQQIEERDTDELGIVDKDDELDDDMILEDEPVRGSQVKVAAELTSIALKPSTRVYTLKITSKKMIANLTKIYEQQRSFMMKFKVPVQKENDEVTKWQEVEFETTLTSLSLKGDRATCNGRISHEGAVAMSKVIQNWKDGIEFFLDGIQQSLI